MVVFFSEQNIVVLLILGLFVLFIFFIHFLINKDLKKDDDDWVKEKKGWDSLTEEDFK